MSVPIQAPGPHDDVRAAAIASVVHKTARARDHERVLADAALPNEISGLVREVVRATRLKRHEKADVAAELVAHFQDGLDSGATTAELLGSFGDVRTAALLIRRGKIRNRSALWHATRFTTRAVGALFCSMVVIYVALLIRMISGSPTISRNYLAEMNAPVDRIPVAQRAWPKWREALRALPEPKVDPDGDLSRATGDVACSPEYAVEAATALRLAREAAKLPHLGVKLSVGQGEFTLDDKPQAGSRGDSLVDQSLIGVLLAPLGKMRQMCHPLATEAIAAARAGNSELAVEDLEALVALADHVGEVPTLISELVSLAIYAKTLETIKQLLVDSPTMLSEAQWKAIAHRLAAYHGGTIRPDLAIERVFFADVVQRLYTDDGHGDGRLVGNVGVLTGALQQYQSGSAMQFDIGMPIASALMAGRADLVAKYDELMSASVEESTIPLWKKGESRVDALLREINSSVLSRSRYLLISILMPSLQRASIQGEIVTQQRDATLVAIALQMFHRRNGRYPAALGELTPALLPSVPVDRFDGFALRYRVNGGQPVLYSVGADGDDDGGRVPATESGRKAISQWLSPSERANQVNPPEGDWVLWPPLKPVATATAQ